MKKHLFLVILLLIQHHLSAQVAGNHIYGNHSNNYRPNIPNKGTSQFHNEGLSIQVNLLLEKTASSYKLTVGAHQEDKSVETCNEKINARINLLIRKLQQLGIKKEAIYVDFISH